MKVALHGCALVLGGMLAVPCLYSRSAVIMGRAENPVVTKDASVIPAASAREFAAHPDVALREPAATARPQADPSGLWTWTARNRNGQSVEHTLRVAVAPDGAITGTLSDALGTRPISEAVVRGDKLTFTVHFDSPGRGDVPATYTVSLDPDHPKVTEDRDDPTPGAASGKQRHREHTAKHTPGD